MDFSLPPIRKWTDTLHWHERTMILIWFKKCQGCLWREIFSSIGEYLRLRSEALWMHICTLYILEGNHNAGMCTWLPETNNYRFFVISVVTSISHKRQIIAQRFTSKLSTIPIADDIHCTFKEMTLRRCNSTGPQEVCVSHETSFPKWQGIILMNKLQAFIHSLA